MAIVKDRELLAKASINADTALTNISSDELAHIPYEDKAIWASAAIIHCDFCRLYVALQDTENMWVMRLLWVGDIASKLYEARAWYIDKARPYLLNLSTKHDALDREDVLNRINFLLKSCQPQRVQKFKDYRNKVGFHYDLDLVSHWERFGALDADEFFEIFENFIDFSRQWLELTKELLERAHSHN